MNHLTPTQILGTINREVEKLRERQMANLEPNYQETMQNHGLLKRLLTIPIFYRVLVANSAIIFVGATVGTWLATQLRSGSYAPTIILVAFVTVGWLVSVALNFVLLQFAFRPLMDLGKIMNRVQAGERSLRAPLTGVDPQADQLASTFNMMLEAIDEANRQRATLIINAQEEERKRVARELHDETSQVLTSLLISLAILEESITSQQARDRIAETRQLAHQTLRAIRNLSLDLRPSALDDLGLLPALRWYIKEYQQKCAIEVDFQASGFKERLPTELETVLYRIVQEALTNVARHAQARKVTVRLEGNKHEIHAIISDNGHGFDVEKVQKMPGAGQEHGWGLVGMHERASLLDGNLTITSRPEQGTTIDLSIPLHSITTSSQTNLSNITGSL
jgi:two-component system sensor histidine kinase UhpB